MNRPLSGPHHRVVAPGVQSAPAQAPSTPALSEGHALPAFASDFEAEAPQVPVVQGTIRTFASDESVRQFIKVWEEVKGTKARLEMLQTQCPSHLSQDQFFQIGFPFAVGHPAHWDDLKALMKQVDPDERQRPITEKNFELVVRKFRTAIRDRKTDLCRLGSFIDDFDLDLTRSQSERLIQLSKTESHWRHGKDKVSWLGRALKRAAIHEG